MSNKKVRAGHSIFLAKVIEEVEERLHDEYAAIGKAELLKWKASLKEQLGKILPLDEQILDELGADEKVTEEEMAEEIERSGRLKADATQALASIQERLKEQAVPPGSSPAPRDNQMSLSLSQGYNSPGNQQKAVRAKLQKLELKTFSGKLGEWQQFWDSIESAIHLNDGLSKVDKFSYLRSLLLEPARSAIGGFALTSANYESAIELLKKRYGKTIAIQRSLVNELLNTCLRFR